jgi:hypothetical protein
MRTFSSINTDDWDWLTANVERFKPFLDAGGEWSASDFDNATKPQRHSLQSVREHNAIKRVGEVSKGTSSSYAYVYRWNPEVQDRLQEYLAELDTLPCGHRAHVKHHDDVDGLTCRYCINLRDEFPEFDKATVKERL